MKERWTFYVPLFGTVQSVIFENLRALLRVTVRIFSFLQLKQFQLTSSNSDMILWPLHWLKRQERIEYKIVSTT